MTRQSAGELYARLRAEKDNPRGDIWYGGTGDPHLQAADGGTDRAVQVAHAAVSCGTGRRTRPSGPAYRTVGLYLGALGFGYNSQELAKRRSQRPPAGPTC